MPDDRKAPVLLVDDRPEDLLLFETLLADCPVDVIKARSGEEALEHLTGREFAVVVLDVRLGRMNGFETARRIRALPEGRRTPIMFLTAVEFEDEAIVEAYGVGAVDFLIKPLNPTIFRSKVRVFADLYLIQREQIETLQEVDRMKDQFLGMVSHELRTPLHFIIGAGSIVEEGIAGPLTEQQRGCLTTIMSGADSLLQLVNDLLDMTQIRAGKFGLTRDWVSLTDAAREALNRLQSVAIAKRLEIRSDLPSDLPPVWADSRRLLQILYNLLGNAFKFTQEAGNVVIRAVPEPGALRCEIEDTGMGVSEADLERVFEPFWQADMSSTREAGGTGLGLAITKALVEAHGGQLGVQPRPGGGSIFWFTLATQPPATTEPTLNVQESSIARQV